MRGLAVLALVAGIVQIGCAFASSGIGLTIACAVIGTVYVVASGVIWLDR